MKKYTFEVTIYEGNDHMWADILANNKTGCDELFEYVKSLIRADGGFDDNNSEVKLTGYSDK